MLPQPPGSCHLQAGRLWILLVLVAGCSALKIKASAFSEHLEHAGQAGQHYGYLLENGDDALLARIHLIRHATETIDIQTFIWEADDSGIFVFAELLAAARRGVRVRLLIDDLSLRKNAEYVAYIATVHPNIELRQYNPVASQISANVLQLFKGYVLEFGNVNQRMHTKAFIVDGRLGIAGGRNYSDEYFDRGAKRSFKDRDLLVAGPVAGAMTQVFEDFWRFELSVRSRDMKDVRDKLEAGTVSVPVVAEEYAAPPQFHALSRCADNRDCVYERIVRQAYPISNIEYVADAPGKSLGSARVPASTESLWQLIEGAEHSITLQSPYLVIGNQSVRRLKKLRRQKPDLVARVSTNSLAASDHFQAYAYSYKNKKSYLKSVRLQVFEFKPRPVDEQQFVSEIDSIVRDKDYYVCVHGKTFIFDSRLIWLGSFNLDRRSSDLNTEAGFVIADESLAEDLEILIGRDMAPQNAWTMGLQRNVPVLTRVSRTVETFFKYVPFVNVWPFRYTTSYELREGGEVVPFYHEDFYDNYRLVGQFPGKTGSIKSIQTRLWKAFLGPAEPIF